MMDDDKRAEAMRKAIEEADAQSKSVKKTDTDSGNSTVSGLFDSLKNIFSTRISRIILIVVVIVIILVIVLAVALRGRNREPKIVPQDISYEISEGVICPYESSNSETGYAYDAYVAVLNTGDAPLTLSNGQFQISDENGTRLMLDRDINMTPNVVEPGEYGYLYNNYGTDLVGVTSSEVDCYLSPIFATEWTGDSVPDCSVNDVIIGNLNEEIDVNLTNESTEDYTDVVVSVITYSSAGYATSISVSDAFSINVGETKDVVIDNINFMKAWADEPIIDYDIYVYFEN